MAVMAVAAEAENSRAVEQVNRRGKRENGGVKTPPYETSEMR